MSNSTRPGGYDERLVVPLEASRRGAHRARVSPLLAALPLLAVVVVVAAVIGVAYTLFLKPPTNDASDPLGTAPNPGTTSSAPAASAPAGSTSQPAASPSSPARAGSSSAATGGTIDKTAKVTVYNGSVPAVNGLAREGAGKLTGAGFTGAGFVKGRPRVTVNRTTVYYASDSDEATAKALAKALGVGTTKLSADVAGSGIVVIVANDFAP
jgi:hypothetical protein